MNKECRKCGEILPVSEFHRDRNAQDGLTTNCKACARQRVKEWREANPDRVKENNQRAYQQNRSEYIERAAKWAAENPERRNEIRRSYEKRNRKRVEQKRESFLADFQSDRTRLARYRRRSSALRRTGNRARDISQAEWNQLYELSGGYCVYCGEQAAFLEIDHLTPVSAGGETRIGNLVPCCEFCNGSKSNRMPEEWIYEKHGVEGLARTVLFIERPDEFIEVAREVRA